MGHAGLSAVVQPTYPWGFGRFSDMTVAGLGYQDFCRRCRAVEADRSLAEVDPKEPDLTPDQKGCHLRKRFSMAQDVVLFKLIASIVITVICSELKVGSASGERAINNQVFVRLGHGYSKLKPIS